MFFKELRNTVNGICGQLSHLAAELEDRVTHQLKKNSELTARLNNHSARLHKLEIEIQQQHKTTVEEINKQRGDPHGIGKLTDVAAALASTQNMKDAAWTEGFLFAVAKIQEACAIQPTFKGLQKALLTMQQRTPSFLQIYKQRLEQSVSIFGKGVAGFNKEKDDEQNKNS